MVHRIAIVGARRARQGTGPYLAAACARLGHDVCGIVGTSRASVARAQRALRKDYHIRAAGYTDLAELLGEQSVDVVVVASPHETHLRYLRQGLDAGCHVFCEKPLWFPPLPEMPEDAAGVTTAAARLLETAAAAKLHVGVNLQWPFTLPCYRRLHPLPPLPLPSEDAARITSFDMRLSPAGCGKTMVLDSAPHLISMLQALLGRGEIENPELRWGDEARSRAEVTFGYRHRAGATRVRLVLVQSARQPRAAGYAINGNAVERRVEMENYVLSLAAGNRQITMQDPLTQSARHFIRQIEGDVGDGADLVHGLRLLHRLVGLD